MRARAVAVGVVALVGGCDAVFSTPSPTVDAAVDTVDARVEPTSDPTCMLVPDAALCITFEDSIADGMVTDWSMNSNDAFASGVTIEQRKPGHLAVRVGDESQIQLMQPETGLDAAAPISWAMWINYDPVQPGSIATILDNHNQYAINIDVGNAMVDCRFSSTDDGGTVTAAIAPNEWHHVACVKEPEMFRIFVDGAPVMAMTNMRIINGNHDTTAMRIGQDAQPTGAPTNVTRGVVDDVIIVPFALDRDKILELAMAAD